MNPLLVARLALALGYGHITPVPPLSDLPAHFKLPRGTYHYSTGFNGESVELRRGGRFQYSSWTDVGDSRREVRGRYRLDGRSLTLEPDQAAKIDRHVDFPTSLVVVPWAKRIYLIREKEIPDFCAAIRAGEEPGSGREQFLLLASGARWGRTPGLPSLPPEWRSLLNGVVPVPTDLIFGAGRDYVSAAAHGGYALLNRGRLNEAERTVRDALWRAEETHPDEYRKSMHELYQVLGRIALRNGDVEGARKALLAAGRAPEKPWPYGLPSMDLAWELLCRDERQTVVEYLRLARRFYEPAIIDSWITYVEAGGIPAFPRRKWEWD